jgi:hypothetical protein
MSAPHFCAHSCRIHRGKQAMPLEAVAGMGRGLMDTIKVIIAALLLALPAVVRAQYYYTVNGDNTITITGYPGEPSLPSGALSIPSTLWGGSVLGMLPVTSIGNSAFNGCTKLSSMTIPTSVTNIGDYAFYGCTGLTYLTLGVNVANIGNYAFYGCSGLSSMTMPNSVTSIGDYAFYHCYHLPNVTIGTNVVTIGNYAFCYAFSIPANLPNVTILNGVSKIGNSAFADTCLSSMTIPNSVTSIGNSAFYGCTYLTSLTIGTNVANIGAQAFYSCTGLSFITLPNSVTSIGDYAFAHCSSLINLTIPASVTLVASAIAADNATIISGSYSYTLNSDGTITITGCMISNGVVAIPSTVNGLPVTSIGSYTFYFCSSLTNVTIPAGVTNIGAVAFDGCTNLVGLYFFGNAPTLGSGVFTGDTRATVYFLPNTSGWGSFTGPTPVLWLPQANNDASFGVKTNRFGFNINWASGMVVIVDACTNLTNPVWVPVSTNTLPAYFSDPQWTNYPGRFYRFRSP